jgi:hypothetical protein
MFSFVLLKERLVLFDIWYLSNLLSINSSSPQQDNNWTFFIKKKKKQKEIVGRSSLFGWLLDIKVQ